MLGDPLPDNLGEDVLGNIKREPHDGFPREAWIIVGEEPSRCCFLVNLGHISGISPRWDNARTRNCLQRRSYKEILEIEFRDEDPEAMYWMLCAMHKNTRMLPDCLTFSGIVAVTCIAENYNLHRVIATHIDHWLTEYRPRITETGYESWLYVAYQFGLHGDYFDLANYLAMNCEVNDRGVLLIPDTIRPLEPIDVPRAHCRFNVSSHSSSY